MMPHGPLQFLQQGMVARVDDLKTLAAREQFLAPIHGRSFTGRQHEGEIGGVERTPPMHLMRIVTTDQFKRVFV
jgi:hypothetical protein